MCVNGVWEITGVYTNLDYRGERYALPSTFVCPALLKIRNTFD